MTFLYLTLPTIQYLTLPTKQYLTLPTSIPLPLQAESPHGNTGEVFKKAARPIVQLFEDLACTVARDGRAAHAERRHLRGVRASRRALQCLGPLRSPLPPQQCSGPHPHGAPRIWQSPRSEALHSEAAAPGAYSTTMSKQDSQPGAVKPG